MDEGDVIEVVFGAEKLSPVQFHTLDIGPFVYRTHVKPGETPEQAFDRAHKFVLGCAKKDYVVKMPVFLENVRLAAEAARKR